MDKREFAETLGDAIDKLVTLDVGARGVIDILYREARKLQGNRPLTLQCAEKLASAVEPGDYVFINTGWIIPGHNAFGETDGPIGTAVLARALALGLKAKPIVLTEPSLVEMVAATCHAAGVNVMSLESLRQLSPEVNRAVAVVPFPIDDSEARAVAKELMDDLAPVAVISIEKNGPNDKGVPHMMRGFDRSQFTAKAQYIHYEAQNRGIFTIGIGDLGNEIGMGNIDWVVKELLPFGGRCKCPCGGGAADATKVDIVLPATISNWGAYGIVACLSVLLQRETLLHDEIVEAHILDECVRSGGVDGLTGEPIPSVDGTPKGVQMAIVGLMREIVRAPLIEAGTAAKVWVPKYYYGLEESES